MKSKPDDREPEPPGGRAEKRLREFIEKRYPGGTPFSQQGESEQLEEALLTLLQQSVQELIEAHEGFKSRLDHIEQTIQKLMEVHKGTGAGSEE